MGGGGQLICKITNCFGINPPPSRFQRKRNIKAIYSTIVISFDAQYWSISRRENAYSCLRALM